MFLDECKIGHTCILKGFKEGMDVKMKRRLLDLGFIAGEKVKVVRKSLLGKVLLIEIGGYSLSLQRAQARWVECE